MENIMKKRFLYVFFIISMLFTLALSISVGLMGIEIKQASDDIDKLDVGMVGYEALKLLIITYNITYINWIFELSCSIVLFVIALMGLVITWRSNSDNFIYLMINLFIILISLIFAFTITNSIASIPEEYKTTLPGKSLVIMIFSYLAMACGLALCFLKADYKYLKGILTMITFFFVFVSSAISLSESVSTAQQYEQMLGEHNAAYDKGIAGDTFLMLLSLVGTLSPISFMINFKENLAYETNSNGSQTQVISQAHKPTRRTDDFLDSEEKLRKLKTLLDDGIISEDEYNEKRKKYIDYL